MKEYRLKYANFAIDWNWFFVLPTINILFKQKAVLLHWLGFHLAISAYLRAELEGEDE